MADLQAEVQAAAGELVAAGTETGLQVAVLRHGRVLADGELAIRMGEAGRERVRAHFEWDRKGERLERLVSGAPETTATRMRGSRAAVSMVMRPPYDKPTQPNRLASTSWCWASSSTAHRQSRRFSAMRRSGTKRIREAGSDATMP